MFIVSQTLPDIQKAIDLGRSVPAAHRGKCTASLPALLHLALVAHRSEPSGRDFVSALGVPQLPSLIELLNQTGRQRAENDFGTYSFEAFRIGGCPDILTQDWTYFCDRFRRAASRRKQSPAALALTSVFREMADNVVYHAYADPKSPCRALAAYHVTDTMTCFSVVDDGQGFLRSLKRRSIWSALATDHDALDAVITKHATSREGEAQGGGFKQLFSGLLNLNGLVVLRSGVCSYTLRNAGSIWQKQARDAHLIRGSQVTFLMDTRGNAEEKVL